jgi:hypothetical protein
MPRGEESLDRARLTRSEKLLPGQSLGCDTRRQFAGFGGTETIEDSPRKIEKPQAIKAQGLFSDPEN